MPRVDEDAELAAIRARLRQEMMTQAAAPAAPPALDRPVDIDDAGLPAFVQAHRVAVVDCWAPWCGPCRIVGPIVDELAREMSGRVAFAKLNVDDNPRSAAQFQVQSIPTLLVFRDGRLVDRLVGALPKPALAAHLERHAGGGRRGGASATPGPRRL